MVVGDRVAAEHGELDPVGLETSMDRSSQSTRPWCRCSGVQRLPIAVAIDLDVPFAVQDAVKGPIRLDMIAAGDS